MPLFFAAAAAAFPLQLLLPLLLSVSSFRVFFLFGCFCLFFFAAAAAAAAVAVCDAAVTLALHAPVHGPPDVYACAAYDSASSACDKSNASVMPAETQLCCGKLVLSI